MLCGESHLPLGSTTSQVIPGSLVPTSPIQLPGVTRYSLQVKHGLAGNGTRSLGGKAYHCVAATSLKVRIRADTAHAVQRGMRLRQHAAFGDAELPDSV